MRSGRVLDLQCKFCARTCRKTVPPPYSALALIRGSLTKTGSSQQRMLTVACTSGVDCFWQIRCEVAWMCCLKRTEVSNWGVLHVLKSEPACARISVSAYRKSVSWRHEASQGNFRLPVVSSFPFATCSTTGSRRFAGTFLAAPGSALATNSHLLLRSDRVPPAP
jgi:hypothetical protein